MGRILAAQMRRVAARYGGEEFVLMLPNTGAEGCSQVGERVRSALRELAMPHALNPPSRLITVSLGGATCAPAQGKAEPATLLAAADRALYETKNGGRDRLVMLARIFGWSEARGVRRSQNSA